MTYNKYYNEPLYCSVSDERYATIASWEATKSQLQMKHGCIAVAGGKIVAKGCNTYKTYSRDRFFHNCSSCHAEINVLRKCAQAKIGGNKIALYIVRTSKHGEYVNSKPCIDCINHIVRMRVKTIVHSTSDGNLVKLKVQDLYDIESKEITEQTYKYTSGKIAMMMKRLV